MLLSCLAATCQAGLLGAGHGEGSCAAAPFRTPVEALKWPHGCPAGAECCTEYGYCRPQAEWAYGAFRDCNGVSNGKPLPPETIDAENAAALHGDTSAAALLAVPAAASAPAIVAHPAPAVVAHAAPLVAAPAAAYAPAPAVVAHAAPAAAYAAAPVAAYAPAAPAVVAHAAPAAAYAPAPAVAAYTPAAAYAAAPAAYGYAGQYVY